MARGHERAARFLVRWYQLPPFRLAPSRSSAQQTRMPSHTLHRQPIPPSVLGCSGWLLSFHHVRLSYRTILLASRVTTPALVQTSRGRENRADSSRPTKTPTSTLLMAAIIPAVVRKTCHQDGCNPTL